MAFFTDFWDFVEYSTSVEYSDGHEKIFWPKKQIKITQKNFHVNRMSSLEDLDRVTPQKKFGGGSSLSST